MTDLPLLTYVATMSVTPGPNNLMLAASGVNFGFRRTVPHMLGISIGHGIQVAIVAGLLAWVMAWLDDMRLGLVLAGCAYLLWLAWRQAQAGQPGGGNSAQPLGFIGAALFQWVNPKAWMMVLNAARRRMGCRTVAGARLHTRQFPLHRPVGRRRRPAALPPARSARAARVQLRDGAAAGGDSGVDTGRRVGTERHRLITDQREPAEFIRFINSACSRLLRVSCAARSNSARASSSRSRRMSRSPRTAGSR